MERLSPADRAALPPAIANAYTALLGQVGRANPLALERDARRFEEAVWVARPLHPRGELLRARVALLLANLLPLGGIDAGAQSERALQIAKALRGSPGLRPGSADGVLAECFLARCSQATSTAKRALLFHQGRAAALRSLEADPGNVSANFAMGSFALHTPRAFGGSLARAVHHLGRVLETEPRHEGARLLLVRAYRGLCQGRGATVEPTSGLAPPRGGSGTTTQPLGAGGSRCGGGDPNV